MSIDAGLEYLLIIQDDKGRRELVLTHDRYIIGRDPDCDIQLISHFVSRRHATLICCPEGDTLRYKIVDGFEGKASANGLMINGAKKKEHLLVHADEIIFGPGAAATFHSLKWDAISTAGAEQPLDATVRWPLSSENVTS